jgi:hypothetical protein
MIPRAGIGGALFAVAVLFSMRDLLSSNDAADAEQSADSAASPTPSLKNFDVPTIKFLYWYVVFGFG